MKTHLQILLLTAAGGLLACSAHAASIPGLFNTGVDNAGTVLAEDALELHYVLVPPSASTVTPVVTTAAGGYPVQAGVWLVDNGLSTWLTPSTNANAPGAFDGSANYYFLLPFDLAGLDPAGVSIAGQWSTDNAGRDILLNGQSTGLANTAQFASFTPFNLGVGAGFVPGLNTLVFVVNNGQGETGTEGPVGLRVEWLSSSANPLPQGTAVSILTPPANVAAREQGRAWFYVSATGSPPVTYQWRLNNSPLDGATNAVLALVDVGPDDVGPYSVVVTNPEGSLTSSPAQLTLLPVGDVNTARFVGVVLGGIPGRSYQVDASDAVGSPLTWNLFRDVVPTSRREVLLDPDSATFPFQRLFRAQEKP